MNSHLSEDQFIEAVLGTSDPFVLRHLATCHACSLEADELRGRIVGFRDAVHARAQRDQGFWRGQQITLRQRISATDWYPLHWAWVMAMVMVLIAAIFLLRTPNPTQNCANDDADRILLEEVQTDLGREVPQALTPAVLISEERNEILTNQAAQSNRTLPKKTR